MNQIIAVSASEILDSRGQPTIEVSCVLAGEVKARASVPAGASAGRHEALELRDGDQKRYGGLGVLTAVKNVSEEINRELAGRKFDQASLDQDLIELDGTPNKSRLGANAILGVSLAFARASALAQNQPLYRFLATLAGNPQLTLPQPMFNVINGGRHADSGLRWQEFMLAPIDFPTVREKIEVGAEIIASLKQLLSARGQVTSLGDEGGFAPKLKSNEEALDLLVEAITAAGYDTTRVKIALDVAATTFYQDGRYAGQTTAELIATYAELVERYPIISIEDGLAEDDWAGFADLNRQLGARLMLVGDDLTVTNVSRIKKAVESRAVNAVLIKPNQIGTLTETIAAVKMTREAGWTPFASHRSGETDDTFIADLAVGLACPYLKAGSLAREERVLKYNRLMAIERELGK